MSILGILIGYLLGFLAIKCYTKFYEGKPRIKQEYRSGSHLTTYVWHKGDIVYSNYVRNMKDVVNKLEVEKEERLKAEKFIADFKILEIGRE